MVEVSVITAAHNSASVIERNIRSVGAQSVRSIEHIIIDDGSDDETVAIAGRLREEFPHLVIIRQANRGAGSARNAGIKAATGRFVAFLDSDDVWTEQKLESQIRFMRDNNVEFSYGDYYAIDADTGAVLGRYEAPDMLTYSDLLRGCPIGCLTVAYDQSVLGKRFMPEVRRGQDWGFWLELTRDGTVGRRYPGSHARYAHGGGSLSSAKLGKAADIYRIYREHERVGPARTLYYMFPHLLGALTKRPVRHEEEG
jgi:teichuronic acid biosynthesis glycosyltransferase TuaG